MPKTCVLQAKLRIQMYFAEPFYYYYYYYYYYYCIIISSSSIIIVIINYYYYCYYYITTRFESMQIVLTNRQPPSRNSIAMFMRL